MHLRWTWLLLLLTLVVPLTSAATDTAAPAGQSAPDAPAETEPGEASPSVEESSPSTDDGAPLTKREQKRQDRMDKLITRTMTRYGLPTGQEGVAQDVLVRQAVYTRRTGRRLVTSGSVFVSTGSLMIGGGLLAITSGDIGAAFAGLLVGAGGIVLDVVGITQLSFGIPLREGAKARLRDLGVDPRIPTKEALVLSIVPMLGGDRKGLQLALRF